MQETRRPLPFAIVQTLQGWALAGSWTATSWLYPLLFHKSPMHARARRASDQAARTAWHVMEGCLYFQAWGIPFRGPVPVIFGRFARSNGICIFIIWTFSQRLLSAQPHPVLGHLNILGVPVNYLSKTLLRCLMEDLLT